MKRLEGTKVLYLLIPLSESDIYELQVVEIKTFDEWKAMILENSKIVVIFFYVNGGACRPAFPEFDAFSLSMLPPAPNPL